VHPEPRQAEVVRVALEILGGLAEPVRAPSILCDSRLVRVKVAVLPPRDVQDKLTRTLRRRTGFALELREAGPGAPMPHRPYDDQGRMEVNAALQEIARAFAAVPRGPYRKSKKSGADGPYLELSFISPEVGRRHESLLEELSYRTSWPIVVSPRVDQQGVLNAARRLIPGHWDMAKGPGLDVAGRKVRLKLRVPPAQGEVTEVERALEEETGFTLELR